jgi:hypothetical protein
LHYFHGGFHRNFQSSPLLVMFGETLLRMLFTHTISLTAELEEDDNEFPGQKMKHLSESHKHKKQLERLKEKVRFHTCLIHITYVLRSQE